MGKEPSTATGLTELLRVSVQCESTGGTLQQNPASPDPQGQGQAPVPIVEREWEAWRSSQISAEERCPGKHSVAGGWGRGWDGSVGSSHLPFLGHFLQPGATATWLLWPHKLCLCCEGIVCAVCCWAREIGWGWPEHPRTLLTLATWPQGMQEACVPPSQESRPRSWLLPSPHGAPKGPADSQMCPALGQSTGMAASKPLLSSPHTPACSSPSVLD